MPLFLPWGNSMKKSIATANSHAKYIEIENLFMKTTNCLKIEESVLRYMLMLIMLAGPIRPVMAQTALSMDVQPKSPVLEGFTRYGEIPVNYSTGVPKIEIPLYKIQIGDIEIPITLSYHASGIKVDDVSSEVGLGWVLNSIGMVVQNGIGHLLDNNVPSTGTSDEIDTEIGNNPDDVNTAWKYYQRATGLYTIDNFKDRYTYILPGGESGVIRENYAGGTFYTIPYNPVILDFSPGANDNWDLKIISPAGIEFLYNSYILGSSYFNSYSRVYLPYNIISANKIDTVKISASCRTSTSAYSLSVSESAIISNDDYPRLVNSQGCATKTLNDEGIDYYRPPSLPYNSTRSYIPNIKIDTIETRNELIVFNNMPDQNFCGNNIYRLQSFTVKQKRGPAGERVKQFSFDNDHYFGTSDENYRLKLEGLEIMDKDGNTVKTYSFGYNSTNLPNYSCTGSGLRDFYCDYWGYYNGVKKNHLIPDFLQDFIHTNQLSDSDCGDLHPNEQYAKACILTSIQYPAGGRTEFEYESNKADYNPYPYTKATNTLSMGGVRVKRIINFTQANDTAMVKNYTYGSPRFKKISEYTYCYKSHSFVQYREGSCGSDFAGYVFYTCISNPARPIRMFNGPSVLYGKVTEQLSSNGESLGKTEYSYTIDEPYLETDADPGEEYFYYNPYLWDAGNYTPRLKQEVVYQNDGAEFTPVLTKSYGYSEYACDTFITGVSLKSSQKLEPWGNATDYQALASFGYREYLNTLIYFDTKAITNNSKITRLTTTQITDNGEVVSNTNYVYNAGNLQIKKQTTTSSEEKTKEIIFRYPADINQGVYAFMADRNMINYPIEETTLVSGRVVNGRLTTYKSDAGKYVPDKTYVVKANSPLNSFTEFNGSAKDPSYGDDPEISYLDYDANGKLIKARNKNGIYTYYLWAYSGQYPVAKIESSVNTTVRVSVDDTRLTRSDDLTDIQRDLAYLKGLLSAYMNDNDYMVSVYTYKPLVGMTSETDFHGKTTYYEYDDFGRLHVIKNDDGDVFKQYNYNYKQ